MLRRELLLELANADLLEQLPVDRDELGQHAAHGQYAGQRQ